MSFFIDSYEFHPLKYIPGNKTLTIKSALKEYTAEFYQENNGIINLCESFNPEIDILLIDENVRKLYDKYFDRIDSKCILCIEAIEKNKTLDSVISVLDYLSNKNFTKAGVLYVIGGGIIQDIAAFVGATFKRGINWTLYPTTLLSMSDSCIGGKSSINYKNAKNQIGLFSAPDKIVIDIAFIKTLDKREILSGLGEILKLHLIGGFEFMNIYSEYISQGSVKDFGNFTKLIYNSLSIKKEVIEKDEFDKGYRRALNYGHSLGHVLESLSEYRIPHGQAIAAGMIFANTLGGSGESDFNRQIKDLIFKEYWEIIHSMDINKIFELLKTDKKVMNNIINIVLLDDIGKTKILPKTLGRDLYNSIAKILK